MMDQPGNRMDSVVSSSFAESGMRNLSATNLQRLSTSSYKTKSFTFSGHSRQSSLEYEEPTFPAPDVSNFDDTKWSIIPPVLTNGGLVNAVLKSPEGKKVETLWIGTLSGVETDRITSTRKDDISRKFAQDFNCDVLYVSDANFSAWYEHFCKLILWPILYYMMPDHPKSKAYQDKSWKYYKLVNQLFADKVIDNYKQGDTVWVHDYHLMMVPGMVREKIPDAKIGLFVHTGFPSPEIWRCVCSRFELLRGMLRASMIAFQTQEYAKHFIRCCSRFLLAKVNDHGVELDGRFTEVTAESIGFVREAIDEELEINGAAIKQSVNQIQKLYSKKTLIVARDKLDNVRGIRQKLLSYELFLAKHPELRNKVSISTFYSFKHANIAQVHFMQVATSTTELVELMTSIWDIVARINREYTVRYSQPLEVIAADLPFDRYVAMISAGDIILVSSLREGMGLTPHEFVYCQDGSICKEKKHGVVILSEFTGTSALFAGNDLPCNPWDIQATADLIEKAVFMSAKEKETRWTKLRNAIDAHTGGRWFIKIQEKLDHAHTNATARWPANIPRLNTQTIVSSYTSGTTKLFILDNEDTLTHLPVNPDRFMELCHYLSVLTSSPHNTVYVTSSLDPHILEDMYKSVPNLGLIASNGCFVHHPHSLHGAWEPAESTKAVTQWKRELSEIVNYYVSRIEGSKIIEDYTRLVIDYSAADHPAAARPIIGELCSFINSACGPQGLRAVPVNNFSNMKDTHGKPQIITKTLIIETFETDKVTAIKNICDKNDWIKCSFDWMLVAGDGREDEPVMKWAHDLEEHERDLTIRRVKAGKVADIEIADRMAARARSQRTEQGQEADLGGSFSFTLGGEEGELSNEHGQLGSMKPQSRFLSSEDLRKLQETKPATNAIPASLKVWTISLGQATKETNAQTTLSGGPNAMVALLGKLADVEKETSMKAISERAGSMDEEGYGDDEDDADDGHGSADEDAETAFTDRPFGKPYKHSQDGRGRGPGLGRGAHGYSTRTARTYLKGDSDDSLLSQTGDNTLDMPGHASPPGSMLISKPSPVVSAASSGSPATMASSKRRDTGDTATPITSADTSSPPPVAAPVAPPIALSASPEALSEFDTDPRIATIPDPSARRPWAFQAPALPLRIATENNMYQAGYRFSRPPIKRARTDTVTSNASLGSLASTNVPSDTESSFVRRHMGLEPARNRDLRMIQNAGDNVSSLSPEARGIRPGRDIGDIMRALRGSEGNSYSLEQADEMYGDSFPCLNSDNESDATYQRNRRAELAREAQRKQRKEEQSKKAGKLPEQQASEEASEQATVVPNDRQGKKAGKRPQVDPPEEPPKHASAPAKPTLQVTSPSGLKRNSTMLELSSLAKNGGKPATAPVAFGRSAIAGYSRWSPTPTPDLPLQIRSAEHFPTSDAGVIDHKVPVSATIPTEDIAATLAEDARSVRVRWDEHQLAREKVRRAKHRRMKAVAERERRAQEVANAEEIRAEGTRTAEGGKNTEGLSPAQASLRAHTQDQPRRSASNRAPAGFVGCKTN